jgi:hypothetical protein
MRISFATLIFVFSITVLHAQVGPEPVITVSGSVTDSVTGRGIAGALVILVTGPGKAELAAMRAQTEQGGGVVPAPFSPAVPRATNYLTHLASGSILETWKQITSMLRVV